MQRLENWETNWFFNHCTFFSCFSKPEKNWNLCYWRRFDMMTSKSVRRNVTRSWGLSLEKIEFFSTDFLALVGFFLCLSGTSLHSPSSMVTNYYVQLKNHLSSPFLVKKLLNFWKKKKPGILNFDAILFLFSFANSTPFNSWLLPKLARFCIQIVWKVQIFADFQIVCESLKHRINM